MRTEKQKSSAKIFPTEHDEPQIGGLSGVYGLDKSRGKGKNNVLDRMNRMRTDWATRVVDNTLTHTNLIKFEGEQYSSEFDDFPLKFGSSQLSIAGGVIGVFGIVVKDPALAGIGTVLYMGSVAAYSIIKNLTHRKPQKPWEHDQYD